VGGPCTRTALAADLGLNRSTIKALVDELSGAGLVVERTPDRHTRAGRPSLLVVPQPRAVVVLAVDVGVERATVAAVGIGGEVLGERTWDLERGSSAPEAVVEAVVDAARQLAAQLECEPVAIGVSVPGLVHHGTGVVHEAPNLHWRKVPLGAQLTAALGLPAHVGNDADLGALAEHLRGAARDVADTVYLSADVGIGGGIIRDGMLLRGDLGFLGELGHMVVRPDGRACYCGCRGCWETEIGEDALGRALGLPAGAHRSTILARLRALAEKPEAAWRALEGFAEWLALGLANTVNVLAPQLVVLGGLLAALPESVVRRVGTQMRRRSLTARAAGHIRLARSTLGDRAPLIGAAELVFGPVLAHI